MDRLAKDLKKNDGDVLYGVGDGDGNCHIAIREVQ
jgi:hypothetical protein